MKKQTSFLLEWDKIKDANICTFEEFEILFGSNPKGRCFRKYTSYPWSKENFFFGTYEDFSNFQKTTTEIPFYLSNKVGSKVFNLTILSFFRDESNKICAICRCDCGNEVIKSYDAISKGNARSCGCNKGRKAKDVLSVYDLYSDIVEQYWDFERNQTNPKDVPITSEESFWWKGFYDSFQMPIQYLLRKVSGTSFPEQAICFYLKENNIQIKNRYSVEFENKKYEIDIFLPEFNVGIEYDGVFWHSKKQKVDLNKNKAIESKGIHFIRIREDGLRPTKIKNGTEIVMTGVSSNAALANAINSLFSYLEMHFEVKLFKISSADINKNKELIKKQYYLSYDKDNIANHWLSLYWSNKNEIEPYLVSTKSSNKYYFVCREGVEFYQSPNYLLYRGEYFNPDSGSCFFKAANLCFDDQKIIKDINIKILKTYPLNDNIIEIVFDIENNTKFYFDPLTVDDCFAFLEIVNAPFRRLEASICRVSVNKIEAIIETECTPKFHFHRSKLAIDDIFPFTKNTYNLKVTLKKDLQNANEFDILVLLNMDGDCICFNIQKSKTVVNLKITKISSRIFRSIVYIDRNPAYGQKMSEDEARRLLSELKKH